MRKEIISEKEGIALLVLFIIDSAIVLPTGSAAGKDTWIAIIISLLLGVLMAIVYIKILLSFPERDLFDISEILFGRILGKFVNLLYVWFAFHIAALTIADFTYFITTLSFPEANVLLIVIFPALLSIWALKIGIEGIGRFATLILPSIAFLVALVIILLVPMMNLDKLLPVFENGLQPVFKGSFSAFAFPFGESVVLMGVFNCFKEKKSIPRVYILGLIIGGIFIFISKTTELAVLGVEEFTHRFFPAYATSRRISIANFIERIEIIVGLAFASGGMVKVMICALSACKGLSKILSFEDYRFLVTPMVILNCAFMFISTKNILQLHYWDLNVWRYYAFPFEVILPLIMLVLTIIKVKSHKMPDQE